jgi:subtilase family serine protease
MPDRGVVTALAPAGALTALRHLPAMLRDGISGVVGLQQTPVAPNVATASAPATADPCSTYFGQRIARRLPAYDGRHQPYAVCGYMPQEIRSAYGLDQVGLDGKGVSVGIIVAHESQTLSSDVDRWSRDVGLPPMRPGQLQESQDLGRLTAAEPTVNTTFDGSMIWALEETMDVEAIHALAPQARIWYYSTLVEPGVPQPVVIGAETILLTLDRAVADDRVQVLSNSWGVPTGENVPPSDRLLLSRITDEAAVEGITIDFGSGDAADDVAEAGHRAADFPGTSPGVTDVGGTTLEIGASDLRVRETYWGSHGVPLIRGEWSRTAFMSALGGGGGVSTLYAEPAWQRGVVPASEATYGGLAHPGRVVPDVSMDADPTTGLRAGITMQSAKGPARYTEFPVGGTSLSCPLFSAVVALAVQRAGHGLGLITPTLYRAGRSAAPRSAMFSDPWVGHDPRLAPVVVYLNHPYLDPLLSGSYELVVGAVLGTLHSLTGFDDSTGLGSPKAPGLIRALAGA